MDDFEHVTNYIFNHQKKFKILYFLAPKEYFEPKLRFVLDEYDDYEFLKKILKHDLKNIFTTRKLIDLCVRKKIKYVYKKRNLLIQNYLKSHKNKIKIT